MTRHSFPLVPAALVLLSISACNETLDNTIMTCREAGDDFCSDGEFCTATGACAARLPDGADCNRGRMCESDLCEHDVCGITPVCAATSVEQPCMCGAARVVSGYCCDGAPQADPCTSPLSILRLDAGLVGAATYEGKAFAPLAPYAVGPVDSYTYADTVEVAGTVNDPLYRSEHYYCGGMSFLFSSLVNGAYTVHLHNAELIADEGVQRVFSVEVNDDGALSNWNIATDVGRGHAQVRSVDVEVTDGQIELTFVDGAYGCPKISGVEILPRGVLPLQVDPPTCDGVTTCTNNDGCCPAECDAGDDDDCAAIIVFAETFDTLTSSEEMGGTNRAIGWNSPYLNTIETVTGRGKVLQVYWEAGSLGSDGGLGNYRIYLDRLYKELYLSWDFLVQGGFDWGETDGKYGGKFFGGLSGGTQVPIPYDAARSPYCGWMTMNLFNAGTLTDYRYLHNTIFYPDPNPDYSAEGWPWGHFGVTHHVGSWHTFTVRVKMNDLGQANGIFEYFYDNLLVAKEADRIYANANNPGFWVDSINLDTFWGGGGAGYESPKDQFFQFDNLVAFYYPEGSADYRAGASEDGRVITPPVIVDTNPPSPNRFHVGTYTEASGTIASHCAYAMPVENLAGFESSTISVAGATAITITVDDFSFGHCNNVWEVSRQVLRIYEGTGAAKTLKQQFECTGFTTVPTTIAISGNTATIEWRSGRSIDDHGFSLSYTSNGTGSGSNFECLGDRYGVEYRALQ